MKRDRLLLLILSVALAIVLAFAARRLVYDLVVLPISYIFWQIGVMLGLVPEVVRWAALIVVLMLVVVWQLIPELGPRAHRAVRHTSSPGQVESLAIWLLRARTSNYFKWQVAHRLGLVSRRSQEVLGGYGDSGGPPARYAEYLTVGLSRSFVDFPTSRRLFRRRVETPLDVDPVLVVGYLESLMLTNRGENARGR